MIENKLLFHKSFITLLKACLKKFQKVLFCVRDKLNNTFHQNVLFTISNIIESFTTDITKLVNTSALTALTTSK